jgi:hypothetical protein
MVQSLVMLIDTTRERAVAFVGAFVVLLALVLGIASGGWRKGDDR